MQWYWEKYVNMYKGVDIDIIVIKEEIIIYFFIYSPSRNSNYHLHEGAVCSQLILYFF